MVRGGAILTCLRLSPGHGTFNAKLDSPGHLMKKEGV